jgi:hypothetical protein
MWCGNFYYIAKTQEDKVCFVVFCTKAKLYQQSDQIQHSDNIITITVEVWQDRVGDEGE